MTKEPTCLGIELEISICGEVGYAQYDSIEEALREAKEMIDDDTAGPYDLLLNGQVVLCAETVRHAALSLEED